MNYPDFKHLIHTAAKVLLSEEERQQQQTDQRLEEHGYGRPQPGADGHVTYTQGGGKALPLDQILVDVPSVEWHHMVNGVVNRVGKMDDDSLENYLDPQD